jgi:hypothetical protein
LAVTKADDQTFSLLDYSFYNPAPAVTPNGNCWEVPNPNVGTVVATPTFVPGIVWQQWMCAAVSGEVNPANDAMIRIVSAVVSGTTAAEPIPGERVGGTSFEPVRIPPKVSVSARADGVGSTRAASYNSQHYILHFH